LIPVYPALDAMDDIVTEFGFPEEKKLLEGCLSRDKKAWDAFVERYKHLISNAILQTLKKYFFDPANQVVPDLFHTVFLSIIEDNYKKLRQFQWKCSLSTWLHLIAVRVTIDYLRKQSEHLSLNGETTAETSLKEGIADGNPLPDRVIELKDEKRVFQQIKKELTSKERLFVELCFSRELSTTRIAAILNTTQNNVYQIKSRVREKMKKIACELL